ncbi:MAG TPA: hypothetical protein VMK32_06030 [Burkholderiaceae bacterium]|nr:hypothetical protein [Burkholderiaceae bacterium]
MATAKKRTMLVGVDVKELSQKLGATVKEGVVSAVRGKYFIKVGALKKEVVVGDTTPAVEVKGLVGPVAVVVSGRTIVAIGRPPRKPWIVCYIPVPDLVKSIRPEVRAAVLQQFVKQGVISAQLQSELQLQR